MNIHKTKSKTTQKENTERITMLNCVLAAAAVVLKCNFYFNISLDVHIFNFRF